MKYVITEEADGCFKVAVYRGRLIAIHTYHSLRGALNYIADMQEDITGKAVHLQR